MPNNNIFFRMLLLGLPTSVVLMTSFLVLFGDQGLLELSRTEEQLADIRMEIAQIESENRNLEIQIRRLRSSPVQVELLMADKLQKASDKTTVFRFND